MALMSWSKRTLNGRETRPTDLLTLFPTVLASMAITAPLFRVLNRMEVIGQPFPGPFERLMVVANHQSLIDSWLLGHAVYMPHVLFKPDIAPAHLADAENFSWLKPLGDTLRVIPVHKDPATGERHDPVAYDQACVWLKAGGGLSVFIEGTRAHNSELRSPRPSVGRMALDSEASVLPVAITGMHDLFPYRHRHGDPPVTWLRRLFGSRMEWMLDARIGKRVVVSIGEVMTSAELRSHAGSGDRRQQAVAVSQAIMDRIRGLKQQADMHLRGNQK